MKYCDDSFTTHQPRTVYDSGNGTMNHFWDANGNLAQVVDCNHNAARLHEWDEENRLRFVLGEKYAGYYGYDADGERVYKLVGTTSLNQVNGGYMDANVLFDACVLYPNPYMVVTKTGYTKHYYAGTERLATVIGGGGLGEIGNPVDRQHSQHDLDIISSFNSRYSDYDPFEHENNLSEPVGTVGIDGTTNPRLDYTCSSIVLTDLDVLTHQNILLEAIELNAPTRTLEQNVYFYHGDHLGSANWITDADGKPIQYIHYAPYGELIANQQTIGYDERFKFTGKERDAETGYDYFGARFYWSADGIFTTVDPLADKYPNVTPYLYCNGNPIKYVDPDGRAVHVAAGAIIGAVIGGTISGISALNNPTQSRRQVLGAIAGGAVSGAITGGAAAATAGLSFIGTGGTIAISAVAGFIGETSGSAVNQGIGNGEIDGGEVLRAGFVGAAAGTITGAASKGVSEAVKKSGVVQSIQTKMLDGVKSGTGKAAKQQANQTRKSIINFCSPGNEKQFQMKDLITYPADVVGQEVSTGVTTSEPVVDKTQEIQSNVVDKIGL